MKFTLNALEHFYLGPYKCTFRIVSVQNRRLVHLLVHNPCIMGASADNSTTYNEHAKVLPLNPTAVFNGYHIRLVNNIAHVPETAAPHEQSVRLEVLMPNTSASATPIESQQPISLSTSTSVVAARSSTTTTLPVQVSNKPSLSLRLTHSGKFHRFMHLLHQTQYMPLLLRSPVSVVVLAPTDRAFELIERQSPQLFTNLSLPTLTKIVGYHILVQPMAGRSPSGGIRAQSVQGEMVQIDGNRVETTTADPSLVSLPFDKGTVHGLNGMLLPPSMRGALYQNANGTMLVRAISNTSLLGNSVTNNSAAPNVGSSNNLQVAMTSGTPSPPVSTGTAVASGISNNNNGTTSVNRNTTSAFSTGTAVTNVATSTGTATAPATTVTATTPLQAIGNFFQNARNFFQNLTVQAANNARNTNNTGTSIFPQTGTINPGAILLNSAATNTNVTSARLPDLVPTAVPTGTNLNQFVGGQGNFGPASGNTLPFSNPGSSGASLGQFVGGQGNFGTGTGITLPFSNPAASGFNVTNVAGYQAQTFPNIVPSTIATSTSTGVGNLNSTFGFNASLPSNVSLNVNTGTGLTNGWFNAPSAPVQLNFQAEAINGNGNNSMPLMVRPDNAPTVTVPSFGNANNMNHNANVVMYPPPRFNDVDDEDDSEDEDEDDEDDDEDDDDTEDEQEYRPRAGAYHGAAVRSSVAPNYACNPYRHQ